MPAPTIYRSTDASAPVLTGAVGALTALLDACLVSGYTGKAAAGWTKPYTSTNGAVFKQGSGSRGMYLQVDDNGGLTGGARDAACYGFETMTAWNTGTGQFPTVAQRTTGLYIRKSTTADATARPWVLFADALTFYLFVLTGDVANNYCMHGFGEFYSNIAGDAYRVATFLGTATQTTALSQHTGAQLVFGISTSGLNGGQYVPRNFAGVGGSTVTSRVGDSGAIPVGSTSNFDPTGNIYFPNQGDGGLYLAPVRIVDASSPGSSMSGNVDLRGQMRGIWQVCHPTASFADGDTFSGAAGSAFAGRTFQIVKHLMGVTTNAGFHAVETTAWDTSS